MNPDAAVIFNEAELAKAIHEEAHTRPGGANHFRQSFLRDLRDQRFCFSRLAKLRQQQEDPRQTLFAGVEKLIDKIGLGSHATRQEELQEQVGERMLLVKNTDDLSPLNLESRQGVIAVAVASRRPAIPAIDSSPTNSPAETSAIVASLPLVETTVRLARPF